MSFLSFLGYAVIICLNIAAIIFNIGALNSYMQHKKILQSRKLKVQHMFLSSILGIFGILVFPAIIVTTEFPKFGLMYYHMSFGDANVYWEELYQEAEKKQIEYLKEQNRYSSRETGSYIDIWESIWEIKLPKNCQNH